MNVAEYYQRLRHPRVRRVFNELRKSQYWSRDEIRSYQFRKLKQLLRHAFAHVPYYHNVFARLGATPDDIRSFDDFQQLPVLTKATIRANAADLTARNMNGKLIANATGGSTGEPLNFYQDHSYWTIAKALDAYVRSWWNISPSDRTACVWGADREFHELSVKERLGQWLNGTRCLNAFRMDDQTLLNFCRMLLRWRPPYLMGYASALEALARCADANGIRNLRFRAIRSAAEMLWPHQRHLVEGVFQSPVYNFYGSREVNNLAAECAEERKLHLISPWRFVEIIDDASEPAAEGARGFIVVTDLSNYGMPFIRYLNEDLGSMSEKLCACGRSMPMLNELLGRSSDLIIGPCGEIIHGEFFTHLFYGCKEVAQFQVHQTSTSRLVLRFVPVANGSATAVEEIVNRIKERFANKIVVDLERCEQIPLPPSGKHRFTISDIPQYARN